MTSTKCSCCGKDLVISWPHLWAYKKVHKQIIRYFCSWKCLRADEKGEIIVNGNTRITSAEKDQAVDIALHGGDPLEYLEVCGAPNPNILWGVIRKKLQMEHPEIYSYLPEKYKSKKKKIVEIPEAPMPAEAPEAEPVCTEPDPVCQETEKPVAVITKPVTYDGLEVAAIRHPVLGEFYRDMKFGTVDWRSPYGDEISIPIGDWLILTKEIRKILNTLGVDA